MCKKGAVAVYQPYSLLISEHGETKMLPPVKLKTQQIICKFPKFVTRFSVAVYKGVDTYGPLVPISWEPLLCFTAVE